MSRTFIASLTLFVLLLATAPAHAEGWGMPNLNPFSSAPKKTTPYKVKDGKSSSWLPSMPTLPGYGSSAPRRGPTTWDKVKAAPGTMYNKTKQTLSPLNPFATQPKKTSMMVSPKKKDEPSGFWPNWMTVEEKDESQPITVTDWLGSGKRPGDE
jgi:hypothetical protein